MVLLFFIAIAIVIVVFVKIRFLNIRSVCKMFSRQNVIVFGKKGKGKDLLFSEVIRVRKEEHFSNIKYNEKTIVEPLGYLTVEPNTYEEFIKGNTQVIEKQIKERIDYYISDAGIYLPSQYDSMLSKQFKSLPIFYALSRHLGDMNVHANVQNLNRLWIKLREQADYYIKCLGVIKLPKYLLLKVREYESYDDALKNLRPIKRIFNKTEIKIVESQRANIKERYILIPKKFIKYDSRYFHRVIYGYKAPDK